MHDDRYGPSQIHVSKRAPLRRHLVKTKPSSSGVANANNYALTPPITTNEPMSLAGTISLHRLLALGVVESRAQLVNEGCEHIRGLPF